MVELAGITLVAILISRDYPYLGVVPPIFYMIGEVYFQGAQYALAGLAVVFLASIIHPVIHKVGR